MYFIMGFLVMVDGCCAARYPHKSRLAKNCLTVLKISGFPEIQLIKKRV
jgi:hypothetical protein